MKEKINYTKKDFWILDLMQEKNFWYQGRYKFIFYSFQKICRSLKTPLKILEIGGGTGGWLKYITKNQERYPKQKYYLSDPFLTKNIITKLKLPKNIKIVKINIYKKLKKKWDIIFLLDVIEHIENDIHALKNITNALKPNGYLIVTSPALNFFWSKNDQYGGHFRRYSKKDFQNLASKSGTKLFECRYFMFFLSPFYWLARLQLSLVNSKKDVQNLVFAQNLNLPKVINRLFKSIFNWETPLGHLIQFPWGTSIYGVFQKL